MSYKKIIAYLNAENEVYANVSRLARFYNDAGADELLICNYSKDIKLTEEFLSLARTISKVSDIPLTLGCYINRLEDIKKALYSGAACVLVKNSMLENPGLLKEAAGRFGSDKIMLELSMQEYTDIMRNSAEALKEAGIGKLLLKHVELSAHAVELMAISPFPVIIRDSLIRNDIRNLFDASNILGVATDFFANKDIMKAKYSLKQSGITVNIFESSLPFSEFRLNQAGLIPVITQDYRTSEVLMLAYMNEEAYNRTIASGRMTYFSRSRGALWEKGETSGNIQYVRELKLDCDKDTLLARVKQIGPACHTGSKSCFYTSLIDKEYKKLDTFHVLQEVYEVITDRKKNRKEGSYTNYLFDKGIDKILKKCGEEAAEVIIAAKNTDSEELRYEIADFMYHMMVLMVECGLDWNDITSELINRR